MIAACDQKIVFKNAGDTVEQRTDTGGKTDGKHTGGYFWEVEDLDGRFYICLNVVGKEVA